MFKVGYFSELIFPCQALDAPLIPAIEEKRFNNMRFSLIAQPLLAVCALAAPALNKRDLQTIQTNIGQVQTALGQLGTAVNVR